MEGCVSKVDKIEIDKNRKFGLSGLKKKKLLRLMLRFHFNFNFLPQWIVFLEKKKVLRSVKKHGVKILPRLIQIRDL